MCGQRILILRTLCNGRPPLCLLSAPAKKRPEAGKAAPPKMAQKLPAAAKPLLTVVVATPPLLTPSPFYSGEDTEEDEMTEIGVRQSEYDSYGEEYEESEGKEEAEEELDFNLLLAQMRR